MWTDRAQMILHNINKAYNVDTVVSADGQSNWMMGVQLVGTYVLIALLFGFVNGNITQGFGSLASRDQPSAPAV